MFPKLNNGTLPANSGSNTASLVNIGQSTKLFVGGGSADSATGVDQNTLVFKGLRVDYDGSGTIPSVGQHNNAYSPIQIVQETSADGDSTKGNILLAWDPSNYELSNFANTSTGFLTSVNLASNVTGTLPVANGGTGLTAIAKGKVLYASATNTIDATAVPTNGQVLIGNATTGVPAFATITGGTNVTVTNGAGSISIASSIGTIGENVDFAGYNIGMADGWISNDLGNEGLKLNNSGQVFVGTASPTSYFTSTLNIDSTVSLGSSLGNQAMSITGKPCTSGSTPSLSLLGSTASGTGNKGGDILLIPGAGDTNGDGGILYLNGGTKAGSGTNGAVKLRTGATDALTVDANQDVTVNAGSLIVTSATEGIVHTGSGTVTQATDHTTGVTINATSGVITLAAVALAAATNAEFTVTNSTVQTDSVIILTVQDENTTNNAQLTACTHTIANGSFKVSVFNPAATGATSTTASKIHFLIINNSV